MQAMEEKINISIRSCGISLDTDRDIHSQKLGTKILKQMGKIGYLHNTTPQKSGFVVLKIPAIPIPPVLAETAFISNPKEERRLNNANEQDKIANAIFKGILNYY